MALPGTLLCRPRPQPLWCPHRCPQSLGGPGSGGPRLAPLSGAHWLCGRTGQRAGSLARFLLSVNPKPSSVGLRANAADRRLRAPCCLLLSPARSGFGFLWATGLGSLCHLPPNPSVGRGLWFPSGYLLGAKVLQQSELSPLAAKDPGLGRARLMTLHRPPGSRACLASTGRVLGCLGLCGVEAGSQVIVTLSPFGGLAVGLLCGSCCVSHVIWEGGRHSRLPLFPDNSLDDCEWDGSVWEDSLSCKHNAYLKLRRAPEQAHPGAVLLVDVFWSLRGSQG